MSALGGLGAEHHGDIAVVVDGGAGHQVEAGIADVAGLHAVGGGHLAQ
jgi:hypothetical protein